MLVSWYLPHCNYVQVFPGLFLTWVLEVWKIGSTKGSAFCLQFPVGGLGSGYAPGKVWMVHSLAQPGLAWRWWERWYCAFHPFPCPCYRKGSLLWGLYLIQSCFCSRESCNLQSFVICWGLKWSNTPGSEWVGASHFSKQMSLTDLMATCWQCLEHLDPQLFKSWILAIMWDCRRKSWYCLRTWRNWKTLKHILYRCQGSSGVSTGCLHLFTVIFFLNSLNLVSSPPSPGNHTPWG